MAQMRDPAGRTLTDAAAIARSIQLSLENYQIFDDRPTLDGMVGIKWPDDFARLPAGDYRFVVTVSDQFSGNVLWHRSIPFNPAAPQESYAFSIPLASVGRGYKCTAVDVLDADDASLDIGDLLPDRPFYGYRKVLFCVSCASLYGGTATGDYVQFVREIAERLIDHQSAHPGHDPAEPLCICCPAETRKTYHSMGSTHPDGTVGIYHFPEHGLEVSPYRMDCSVWPLFEQLSSLTGDDRYARMVGGMIDVFTRRGFDDRTGLGYFGEECDFDIIDHCAAARGSYFLPKYKGGNTGALPDGPLSYGWNACPEKMLRMARSIYQG